MNEFDSISRYFKPLTEGRPEALGLMDDAAVLNIPEDHELAVTTDMLVAGVHFAADSLPQHIAHKALRVNLSDLAAMGAKPLCYQLAIAFPKKPSAAWLAAFTKALQEDQKTFGIFCSGGDTTRTPGPLIISITALGTVPKGQAVKRSGGRAGDALILSGPVGDAYLGLHCHPERCRGISLKNLKREILRLRAPHFAQDDKTLLYFTEALYKPISRLDWAARLRTHAHAAIDVSDGLIADTAHLARASGCAVQIKTTPLFFSAAGFEMIKTGQIDERALLTGGDDYQIVAAVPPAALIHFPDAIIIGQLMEGPPGDIKVQGLAGETLQFDSLGWVHF